MLSVVALCLVAFAAADVPTLPDVFSTNATITIQFEGGFTHHTTGIIDQKKGAYASVLTDDDGSTFREAFVLQTVGCLNFEVQDSECILGCKASTPCGDHSCSCGATKGVFQYLPEAHNSGTCEGGANQYTAHVAHTDDDAMRGAAFEFCITPDGTPTSLTKTYDNAPVGDDVVDTVVRRLQGNRRINSVQIDFSVFKPNTVDDEVFYPPDNCKC